MDKLIADISRGVGSRKRKRRRSPVLVRLASKRCSDVLLDSGDDSSDEDYLPDSRTAEATHQLDLRKTQQKLPKRRKNQANEMQEKTTPDVPSFISALCDKAWSSYISDEILLKIFHLAIVDAETRLQTLIRLSKVCKLWRRVSGDPWLWRNLDLSYGWIKCPLQALRYLDSRNSLSQLSHLNLSGCSKVDMAFMQVIATQCGCLKSLNIAECKKLNAEGLRVVAGGLPGLQHINLSGLINGFSKSLAALDIIKAHQTTLQKLELSSNQWTHCSELLTCLASLMSLTLLDISGVFLSPVPLVMNMLKCIASSVQVLRMSRCGVHPHASNQQPLFEFSYPQLVEFTAAEARLSQVLPLSCFIKGASNLKHLDVRGWNSADLSYLNENELCDAFPRLQSLNLRNVYVARHQPLHLTQFASSLEQLDISWMKGAVEGACEFSSQIEGLLTPDSKLAAVYCAGMPLSMAQLGKLLNNLSQLCTLDVESCRSIRRGLKRKYHSRQQILSLTKDVLG